MHFKGIVDFALFSSGIHILTLNVLLLSSENMARSMDESKGQNTESLRVQFCFEDSTQQSVNNLIIKVSHLEQLTQTICYVCILFHCSPCLVYVCSSDHRLITVWAVHDSKCISHVLFPCLCCHAYIAGFRNGAVFQWDSDKGKTHLSKPFQTQ